MRMKDEFYLFHIALDLHCIYWFNACSRIDVQPLLAMGECISVDQLTAQRLLCSREHIHAKEHHQKIDIQTVGSGDQPCPVLYICLFLSLPLYSVSIRAKL